MDFEFIPQQTQLREATPTHGGFGYTREYLVERCLRAAPMPRIALASPHLVLSDIAEQVLGLPKSH